MEVCGEKKKAALQRILKGCFYVPGTRVELARLSTLAPETSASTIPPPGQGCYINESMSFTSYIARQERQNSRIERMEKLRIPEGFDYDAVESLSAESRLKFKQVLPATLGQASRISGVRTSDIAILMIHLGKKNGSTAG